MVVLLAFLAAIVVALAVLRWIQTYEPASTLTPYPRPDEVLLQRRPASDERDLKSPPSSVTTSVRFDNRTARDLEVHWLDFDGERRRYAGLGAGKTFENATYVGHVWLVAELDGSGLALFVAEEAPGVGIVQ